MADIKVPIDWLTKRAEEEEEKMKGGIFDAIVLFFRSDKEKEKYFEEQNRSLGRLSMIDEIMKKFISENK